MAAYGMAGENCTSPFPDLQSNPDISGIGITCAFLITAYLTLICCIAKAVLDEKPASKNINRWSFALERTIMSFSDQQIITGISMIIGGISQLEYGISSYHWQNMVNLAWLSTVTHLITLTALRKEFRSNRFSKILRIVSMGVLIVMLICVIGPIGYPMAGEGDNLPAQFPVWCLYHPSIEWSTADTLASAGSGPYLKGYNWVYIALAVGILIFSYCTRVIIFFSDNVGHTLLRIPPGQPWNFIERLLEKTATGKSSKKACFGGIDKLLRSASIILLAGTHLFGSKVWEVTWLFTALLWGTIRIVLTRTIFLSLELREVAHQENVWEFGQVVSIGLLALPFVNFFEAYFSPLKRRLVDKNDALSDDTPSNLESHTITSAEDGLPHIKRLKSKSWYQKLCWLWYLCSIGIVGYILVYFPGFGAMQGLSSLVGIFQLLLLPLALSFMFILMVLLFTTLIFLDIDLRKKSVKMQDI